MKLSSRSYPHPVVGNRDDVPGAAFQAALEMSTDKEAIYIDATIKCSSKTVNDLLKKQDAILVLHVECSNTMYRRVFEFNANQYRAQIPTDNLNDSIEVNVFAKANRNLSGYRVDAAHPDYGHVTFDVEKGNILAIGEGQVFYIDSSFDAMSPIGSIMEIHESQLPGDHPMRVDYDHDKIRVVLSQKDFSDYKLLKVADGVSGALATVIVLPVLLEAIHFAQGDADDDNDIRWVRALKHRIQLMGLKLDSDALELAQQILELPIKRTFGSVRMFAEAGA